MKLGDIKPDPSDAHKTWWPLDKKFKSVDFIRQRNEVCQVTLNPNHDPLDLDKIMGCFEVKLHFWQQLFKFIFALAWALWNARRELEPTHREYF